MKKDVKALIALSVAGLLGSLAVACDHESGNEVVVFEEPIEYNVRGSQYHTEDSVRTLFINQNVSLMKTTTYDENYVEPLHVDYYVIDGNGLYGSDTIKVEDTTYEYLKQEHRAWITAYAKAARKGEHKLAPIITLSRCKECNEWYIKED